MPPTKCYFSFVYFTTPEAIYNYEQNKVLVNETSHLQIFSRANYNHSISLIKCREKVLHLTNKLTLLQPSLSTPSQCAQVDSRTWSTLTRLDMDRHKTKSQGHGHTPSNPVTLSDHSDSTLFQIMVTQHTHKTLHSPNNVQQKTSHGGMNTSVMQCSVNNKICNHLLNYSWKKLERKEASVYTNLKMLQVT